MVTVAEKGEAVFTRLVDDSLFSNGETAFFLKVSGFVTKDDPIERVVVEVTFMAKGDVTSLFIDLRRSSNSLPEAVVG
jgi:hypothetical protein